jgi:flavin reductase (DIM6/NTAB) family NADH-FMN oxidoreductase RutF
MERKPIAIEDFTISPYHFFEDRWLLLTGGDFASRQFNAMTISWGAVGVMWNRAYAQVVVRPVRYTFEFMERYDSFTVCAFPESYHAALSLLGTKSGRDGDKIAEAGLTPVSASCVAAPAYAEAELVIECKKVYWQDLDPQHFLKPEIARNYPRKDYHRMYFGEILAVLGTETYATRREPC